MTKQEIVARAICRETCAYKGEPACFEVRCDQTGRLFPWPPESCDEPGCVVLAAVAILALTSAEGEKP